jgi:hypothetical protein
MSDEIRFTEGKCPVHPHSHFPDYNVRVCRDRLSAILAMYDSLAGNSDEPLHLLWVAYVEADALLYAILDIASTFRDTGRFNYHKELMAIASHADRQAMDAKPQDNTTENPQ